MCILYVVCACVAEQMAVLCLFCYPKQACNPAASAAPVSCVEEAYTATASAVHVVGVNNAYICATSSVSLLFLE